jgi:hypothetical protein
LGTVDHTVSALLEDDVGLEGEMGKDVSKDLDKHEKSTNNFGSLFGADSTKVVAGDSYEMSHLDHVNQILFSSVDKFVGFAISRYSALSLIWNLEELLSSGGSQNYA